MISLDIKQTVADLRKEARVYCMAKSGRFTPIGMINDYERLAKLSQIMVCLKSIGIDTKNRQMRLKFWERVFDIQIASTDDVPLGYAIVFTNWVKNDQAVANQFGLTFVQWFEKHHGTTTPKKSEKVHA